MSDQEEAELGVLSWILIGTVAGGMWSIFADIPWGILDGLFWGFILSSVFYIIGKSVVMGASAVGSGGTPDYTHRCPNCDEHWNVNNGMNVEEVGYNTYRCKNCGIEHSW